MSQARTLIATIDPAELAVLMCEASYGLQRPPGLTANQALDAMEEDCRAGWLRAAKAAAEYLQACIGNASAVQ